MAAAMVEVAMVGGAKVAPAAPGGRASGGACGG